MKAIIGVGYMKQCLAGVDIFARLRFPKSEAVLVHAVEPVFPDGGFMPTAAINPITEIQAQRHQDGEKRMAEVAAELEKLGIPSRSVTKFGNAAHEITDVARYLSILPPEADVANRDPRSGSSLLFRRASSSRPYHSQTSSTAHPIRPQAAG
jgi:hypothetical protein